MKQRHRQQLAQRRQHVQNKIIVGIDPAKDRQQAQLLDPDGLPLGSTFSFSNTFNGFQHTLWKQLRRRLRTAYPELARGPRAVLVNHLVFALEASCNLWQPLRDYLQEQGTTVVLVSPLATYHARPSKSGNFSRTDPKDAYLIADLAREGSYHEPQDYGPHAQALHRLSITYDKLRKDRQRHYARLRAQIEQLFPEFLGVLRLHSRTARHLLKTYLVPEDYLRLSIEQEAAALMAVSRNQHGRDTLLKLQTLARRSIGVKMHQQQINAQRLTLGAWLALIEATETQLQAVETQLIHLAQQTPYHAPLTSLKGVSSLLAALLIAEVRDPSRLRHWKQLERLAGYTLFVSDSGRYKGRRRVSHLGNARLRWILYQMASETSKYIPEVRCKYLRRRLSGSSNRTKNLCAALPKLLGLIVALWRDERPYTIEQQAQLELHRLEARLEDRLAKSQPRRAKVSEKVAP